MLHPDVVTPFDPNDFPEPICPTCNLCGHPMWCGYMDGDNLGEWYCCESCMKEMKANGLMRESFIMPNSKGGYYDYATPDGKTWEPVNVFYTEWG